MITNSHIESFIGKLKCLLNEYEKSFAEIESKNKPKWKVGDKVMHQVDGGIWINCTIKEMFTSCGEWLLKLEKYDGSATYIINSDHEFLSPYQTKKFKFDIGEIVQTIHDSKLIDCQVVSSCFAGHRQLYILKVIGASGSIQKSDDEIKKYQKQ